MLDGIDKTTLIIVLLVAMYPIGVLIGVLL